MSEAIEDAVDHCGLEQLSLEDVTQEGLEAALPPIIIDVKRFLESINNAPVFTRELLLYAKAQLKKANQGKVVHLPDVYGKKHRRETKGDVKSQKVPVLRYNNYLTFADDEPYFSLRAMPPDIRQLFLSRRGYNEPVEELVKNAKTPVYICFEEKCSFDYDSSNMIKCLGQMMIHWDNSRERAELISALVAMKDTAPVNNIVCIGHGSIRRSPACSVQHLIACTLAKELTAIYKQHGKALAEPISVVAQDPAYTRNDKVFLSLLDPPIKVVDDPDGFLTINERSLVLSCCPGVPIKQIVADLALGFPGKSPAAVFWNDASFDEKYDVDQVALSWLDITYPVSLGLKRTQDMLSTCVKVVDGRALITSGAGHGHGCVAASESTSENEAIEAPVGNHGSNQARAIDSYEGRNEGGVEVPEVEADGPEDGASQDGGRAAEYEDTGCTYGMGWLKSMELWARKY